MKPGNDLECVSIPVFCHPERSEGGMTGLWLLRFAQDDTGGSETHS
jgi:hypothetical protein